LVFRKFTSWSVETDPLLHRLCQEQASSKNKPRVRTSRYQNGLTSAICTAFAKNKPAASQQQEQADIKMG
jgi:hypothetical protein